MNDPTLKNVPSGGGGVGQGGYQGIDLHHLAERFDQCVSDPSMRSVSAVLRITREQIMARGQLSIYPRLAYGFGAVGAVTYAISPFLSPELRDTAGKAAVGCLVLSAILAYGAFTSHRERKAAVAQEREIYRLAAESLDRILTHSFPRKPLTREQADTLKDLIKRSPEKQSLRSMLQEAP